MPYLKRPRPKARTQSKHTAAKRRLCVIASLVAVLCVLNALASWMFIPYGSRAGLVWSDYSELTSLNTVTVGPYAQNSVNPRVLDAALESESFNLGTPSQSLNNAYQALQKAIEDWHIERAIVCIEYDSLFEKPVAQEDISFIAHKQEREPFDQAVRDQASLMFSDFFVSHHYSLSCIFPWAYNHVPFTFEDVSANIENRLEGNVHAAARNYASRIHDVPWTYDNTGFVGLTNELSGECTHGFDYAPHKDDEVSGDTLHTLMRICGLCVQNGVRLYVAVPPISASSVVNNGTSYLQRMSSVQELLEKWGCTFFDLNLVKPSLLEFNGDELSDLNHLTATAADEVSTALAELIRKAEAGEDVYDSLFRYDEDGWNEYLSSIKYVDSVDFDAKRYDGNVYVEAKPLTGTQNTVMYQLETRTSKEGRWEVVRAWDLSPTFELDLADAKTLEFRISAKSLQCADTIRSVTGLATQ